MPAHRESVWLPGEPMSEAQLERFLSKIETSSTGCWLWTGAKNNQGYARLTVSYENMLGHRAAYRHFIGDIPAGKELDHLCRTRLCVNPTHTEPVGRIENQRRAEEVAHTHCPAGHPITPENRYYRKNRAQRGDCKPCALERERAKRRARVAA